MLDSKRLLKWLRKLGWQESSGEMGLLFAGLKGWKDELVEMAGEREEETKMNNKIGDMIKIFDSESG